MKVTILMNNDFGLPIARKFNLQMLRSNPPHQGGQHELVIQGKYKGKRNMSAFRKYGRVVIVEGWHEPQSAFNVQPKGELDCFQDDSINQMLKECGNARVLLKYKGRMIEKLEEMHGVHIDCEALMPCKGQNEALEKAKANPNSLFNLISEHMA